MSQALARQVNQHLQHCEQLLSLAQAQQPGAVQNALQQAAALMLERAVALYFVEILPRIGGGTETEAYLSELNISSLLKKVLAQTESYVCAQWAEIYRQADSWLQDLIRAVSVTLPAPSIKGAFFDSDLDSSGQPTSNKGGHSGLIASSHQQQANYGGQDIRTWKRQFVAIVERQRHESEEY